MPLPSSPANCTCGNPPAWVDFKRKYSQDAYLHPGCIFFCVNYPQAKKHAYLPKASCFIWSANGPHLTVEKTLNTADLLPTVLNLMGVKSKFSYIGQDAFDPNYEGYALFPDGSWVSNGIAYSAESEQILIQQAGKVPDDQLLEAMAQKVNQFVYINNLILETNYYHQK